MVRDAGATEPGPPVANGRIDTRDGVVDVRRRRAAFGPRERGVGPLATLQRPARTHAVVLDAERQVRLEPDGLPGSGRIGRMTVVADERPACGRASVVERRLAHELDFDTSLEALDRADEHVLRVVVGWRTSVRRDPVLVIPRAHRQRVTNDDPAARRLPRRLDHVRARHVVALGRVVDSERAEAEEARLAVDQAPEHARRVERRRTEPVDRAVGRHERTGVAVRDERVVGDRRERRRGGRALQRGLCRSFDAHACHGPCQRPCPSMSSSAAAGPQDPGAYGCTGGGESSSG
jgi:hypothetical protein